MDFDVCTEVTESVYIFAAHIEQVPKGIDWLGPSTSVADPNENFDTAASAVGDAPAQTNSQADKALLSDWKHLSSTIAEYERAMIDLQGPLVKHEKREYSEAEWMQISRKNYAKIGMPNSAQKERTANGWTHTMWNS